MTKGALILFLIGMLLLFGILSQVIRSYYHSRIEKSLNVFLQHFEARLERSEEYYKNYSEYIKNQELKSQIEAYLANEQKFINYLKSYKSND